MNRFRHPVLPSIAARAAVGALLGATLGFAPPLLGGQVIDRILVRVNSRVITQSAFDQRVAQTLRESQKPSSEKVTDPMKKSVMEELVNEALLEDRARDLDLVTTDAEVEDQIKRLKEQNQVQSEEEFVRALAANGLTVEKLREQLRRSMTVQRVVGREVNSKVDLSEDALRVTYEREKETWRIPEQVRIAEILIPRGDGSGEARALEAAQKLKGGAKFEDLVGVYSSGATRDRAGDLGFVAKGELNPEIDRVAFSLPVGSVSDPVGTKFGFHIVKVIDKKPVSYKPFSEVKAEILKKEQDTQFQKKLAEYLDKLKGDAVIKASAEASAYYTAPVRAPAPVGPTLARASDVDFASPSSYSQEKPFEVTPTIGYRLGGTGSTYANDYIDSLKIPHSLSWGLTAEYALGASSAVEFLWSHQDTELTANWLKTPPDGYTDKITHLNIDTFQIGGLWMSGRRGDPVRGYLDFLLGVTFLTPSPQFDTLTRFSGSLGLGAKFRVNDALGVKVGARFMPIYVASTNSGYVYCDPWYGCYTYWNANYIFQTDFSLGLTFKF